MENETFARFVIEPARTAGEDWVLPVAVGA